MGRSGAKQPQLEREIMMLHPEASLTTTRNALYQFTWSRRQSEAKSKKWPLGVSMLFTFVVSALLWAGIGVIVWEQI